MCIMTQSRYSPNIRPLLPASEVCACGGLVFGVVVVVVVVSRVHEADQPLSRESGVVS